MPASDKASLRKKFGIPLSAIVASVIALSLLIAFLGALNQGCSGDSTTTSRAFVQFSLRTDETTGLNATPWFQYPVNDSWVWGYNKSLTWAFTANLVFWNFFRDEIQQITQSVAAEYSIDRIQWNLPVQSYWTYTSGNETYEHYSDFAEVTVYGNGSYRMLDEYLPTFPEGSRFASDNITFYLSGEDLFTTVRVAPAATWTAAIEWQHETLERFWLDDENWDEIAKAIAAELKQTWYVTTCEFLIDQPDC